MAIEESTPGTKGAVVKRYADNTHPRAGTDAEARARAEATGETRARVEATEETRARDRAADDTSQA